MALALDAARHRAPVSDEAFRAQSVQALRLIERLHRLLLDVIKNDFDRLGGADLNSVQALLLYNIGDAELTAGELKTRGYYLGSNVSYNLKKLVDMGYIHYQALGANTPVGPRQPDRQGPRSLRGGAEAL